MFNFLKNIEEESNQYEWVTELKQTEERWFTFLEKMEEKMEELCKVAISELNEVSNSDDAIFKEKYHKIQSGIKGQLGNIRKKAYDTYEEKVNDLYYSLSHQISVLQPEYSIIINFRETCDDRYYGQFEEKYQYWQQELEKLHR